MDKHLIAKRLDSLYSDGKRLLSLDASAIKPGELTIWYASALDTLSLFLEADSELIRALKEVRDRPSDPHPAKLSQEGLLVLRAASEVNRLRRGDDLVGDLRRDIQTIIGDIYVKSWWFYGPVGILFMAALFAVAGIVQLRETRINVREEAESALRNAKTSIDEHRVNVERSIDAIGKQAESKADEAKQNVEKRMELQLQTTLEEAKTRINNAANNHFESIKRERTPNLESGLVAAQVKLADVEKRLESVQKQVSTLESSINDMERAIKRIDSAAAAGTLENISQFLNRSRVYVLTELVVNSLLLLFSIVVLVPWVIRRWRG